MSAFIVSDKIIYGIVNTLAKMTNKHNPYFVDYMVMEKIIRKAGYFLNPHYSAGRWILNDCQRLADDMLYINTEAVNYRYNENTPPRQVKKNKELFPDVVLYEYIGMFLYQCSDGTIPDQYALFDILESIQNELAHVIARKKYEDEYKYPKEYALP